MHLKPEVREETRQAVQTFREYAAERGGKKRHLLRQFCRERPMEARVLVEVYDAMHPGLNHLPARKLTRTTTKVRDVLEEAQQTDGAWCRWTRWARHRRLLLSVVIPVLTLPILLSPTHPLAVYAYLVDSYNPSLTPEALAFSGSDLSAFLTSSAQVHRYRADLLDDILDTRSSKLFVIVRCPDGTLRQKAVRTWNGFLPERLPRFLSRWLDRKELPYLGDKVDTWLWGNEIIATGHYHALGGRPSAGDRCAQYLADLPEVVIVNGIVPMVYLDENVIAYGEDVVISDRVFQPLRPIELSLMMDVTQDLSWSEEPSPALRSFLGFLSTYRNVDVSKLENVAEDISLLCTEFKGNYRGVFTKGFKATDYESDPDVASFLRNLKMVEIWADLMSDPRNHVHNDNKVEERRHRGNPNNDDTE